MEKLELRGQRVARMRIFSNDINRNVINLAFNYMSIARAVFIRGRVLKVFLEAKVTVSDCHNFLAV